MRTVKVPDHLRAKDYTRGRSAAILCWGYLAVVFAVWLATVIFIAMDDGTGGASLVGIYIIFLTMPMSFVMFPLNEALGIYDPSSRFGEMVLLFSELLPGLIQAYAGWFVLRGRRVQTSQPVEAGTSAT